MRGIVLIASIVGAGCGFQTQSTPLIPPDATSQSDAPPGVPRVKTGLVGYWTFNDPASSGMAADTSGTAVPVPFSVITSVDIAAPVFDGDRVTANVPGRMLTATGSHLAADCVVAGAVSLEVWLSPAMAHEGTPAEPRFITGIAGNVTLRDIVLLQADNKWLGRVRTTIDLNGGPDLLSTPITSTGMTHLVLVADAQQRVLYVNDQPEATTAAGPPLNWDVTYVAALFDEPQHARSWLGTVAMVALYAHGLTPDEVHQNFTAGPTAP